MSSRSIYWDLKRILTLLRSRIRERGFTQQEVQEAIGWGRSYISQLMTQQKSMRIEQILLILNVIDVNPSDFFGELYQFGPYGESRPAKPRRVEPPSPFPDFPESDDLETGLRRIRILYGGMVHVLKQKGLITEDALEAAIVRSAESKTFAKGLSAIRAVEEQLALP